MMKYLLVTNLSKSLDKILVVRAVYKPVLHGTSVLQPLQVLVEKVDFWALHLTQQKLILK